VIEPLFCKKTISADFADHQASLQISLMICEEACYVVVSFVSFPLHETKEEEKRIMQYTINEYWHVCFTKTKKKQKFIIK